MAKDTYYFSHDYNARNDPKIRKLISRHGITGYGIFWAIVEDLYQNANALPTDYELIAFDMRTECDIVKSIVNDFDLFVIEGNEFGSMAVERRLFERDKKSGKARESAFKRWNKNKHDANAMQTHSEPNAIKERKVKESKVNKSKVFTIPTISEISDYCKERKNNIDPIKFFNHYESNGWMVGRNKMKNWKAAVHTWEKSNIGNQVNNQAAPNTIPKLPNYR